jgi:hypothetical protein
MENFSAEIYVSITQVRKEGESVRNKSGETHASIGEQWPKMM